MRDRHGFGAFAQRAAPQLLRWESRYGWTHGWGQVCEKETSLASVLARMLAAPDAWITFTTHYLAALDQAARAEAAAPASPRIYGSWGYGDTGYRRREQASNLAEWHGLLLERLAGSEAEDHLDRLVSHPALGGPEHTFLQARLARQRGDTAAARRHVPQGSSATPNATSSDAHILPRGTWDTTRRPPNVHPWARKRRTRASTGIGDLGGSPGQRAEARGFETPEGREP